MLAVMPAARVAVAVAAVVNATWYQTERKRNSGAISWMGNRLDFHFKEVNNERLAAVKVFAKPG